MRTHTGSLWSAHKDNTLSAQLSSVFSSLQIARAESKDDVLNIRYTTCMNEILALINVLEEKENGTNT